MKNELLKIGIRYNAVYMPELNEAAGKIISVPAANLAANLAKLGYAMEESLLHRINGLHAAELLTIYEAFADVLQVENNWAPLVKGWDIPTGEQRSDHWLTLIANAFQGIKGTRLQCGHLIPFNTFPLERYNGCPFCGTPFYIKGEAMVGQGSKLKMLAAWTDTEMRALLASLLESKTALDATQVNTLKELLHQYALPEVTIVMKETQMVVIDTLKEAGHITAAGALFKTPVDIMRYLWYKHTGFLQLVEPKVIIRRIINNNANLIASLGTVNNVKKLSRESLKLKYSRAEGKMVAKWMNALPLTAEKSAELMHPKRAMWVRFIRALRLAEFSRHKGMERLKDLLDVFYKENYEVQAGRIEHFRLKTDAVNTFALLKERPGLFARSLFANMLWFGKEDTLTAFGEIADRIPARLLFTLNAYARNYFDSSVGRSVKPLGGSSKTIRPNKLLALYTKEQLAEMVAGVEELCLQIVTVRFAAETNENKTIFIDPALYHMPLPIGDRSETIHELPAALMGTRFPVEGNRIRLFMQWGKGLKAQHLDMDLSCKIAYPDKTEVCSYYNLVTTGAKHSGDIRSIPHKTGTAEYIELDTDALRHAGADYVSFSCNAYSNGAISPNLVLGWMNSGYPMKISERTGVAYDPSCVQHQVKVTQTLTKGLVFGVLDISRREIIWLEQSSGHRTVAELNTANVKALLAKLESKTTVGNLLALKAKAQSLTMVDDAGIADEAYTREWAMDIAGVTRLLID